MQDLLVIEYPPWSWVVNRVGDVDAVAAAVRTVDLDLDRLRDAGPGKRTLVDLGHAGPDAATKECLIVDTTTGGGTDQAESLEQVALARAVRADQDVDLAQLDRDLLERLEILNRHRTHARTPGRSGVRMSAALGVGFAPSRHRHDHRCS